MATVKIWKISSRIDKAIEYVSNTSKTLIDNNEEILKNIKATIDYATNEDKTEQKLFVSGINCQPKFAYKQMIETKEFFHKTDGILAFHAYQSFAPGEVTPKEAHEIGVAFAKKMWGEKYQVVIGTHLNAHCIHNHFVINSVSFIDGKKYNACKASYSLMRKTSDELCREHNLSVIENPKASKKLSYAEYMDDKNNPLSKNNIIRRDIDECIFISVTTDEFLNNMEKRGYTFDFTHKYATVRHKDFERARRLSNLGEAYSPKAIADRINRNWGINKLDIPEQDNLMDEKLRDYDDRSYQNVYVHFVTIVTTMRKRPEYNRRYHKAFSEEVKKLDRLIEQQNLLCDNDIDNSEELQKFKESIKDEMDEIKEAREILRNKLKRVIRSGDTSEENKVRENIKDLSGRLKKLRRDFYVCERIENEEPRIKEKISDTRKIEERKEINRNGYVRGRS